ncbi:alkylglycerol monooxygenase-like [Pollicipes pollicipes]|uniref:alkylglycerol monooxygenase-like n=1 Tax=Pollicipes pollicipes TaxID=41117 RepID=UPI0018857D11|nr:alkylglycerol monooxygenase-like [Pollicipes pollicipes]
MEAAASLGDQMRSAALDLLYIRNVTATCRQHVHQVPDYTRQAVPAFLLLALLEFVLLQTRHRGRAAFADHTVSLASGMVHLVVSAGCGFLPVWAYATIWQRWRLFELPWDSVGVWWLTLVGVDFCFYWQHRALHEVNCLWAMHQAHHSSEYFNLSAAQRQPVLQTFVTGVFYLPLAVLGVPPAMWLSHRAFNFIYQFWIHTELVGSLGPLELVFNTASHHRVHHASNPRYLDRNYGGFLIVWDRLFGTFCAEAEPPTYGLVHNVDSFDLWTVQLGAFARVAAAYSVPARAALQLYVAAHGTLLGVALRW